MAKAYDVMTQALATCEPDESAAKVARIMRDRDIGNVLIVEEGKLRGIVTDRDLAINALAGDENDAHSPVSRYMSTKIVTGSPDWSINKVAKTMAKHQVRRLPIVENGKLVGIIALSDIARRNAHKSVISRVLRDVSKPANGSSSNNSPHLGTWIGLTLAALSTSLVAWLTWTHNGQQMRKQVSQSKPYNSAAQAVNTARDRVNEFASSKTARNLRKQVQSNFREFSQQMPSIEVKPPKRRNVWFR